MPIPTEPIGSIPRPLELIEAFSGFAEGLITQMETDWIISRLAA
jgi:methionine synthase II (cobalamin-independent)